MLPSQRHRWLRRKRALRAKRPRQSGVKRRQGLPSELSALSVRQQDPPEALGPGKQPAEQGQQVPAPGQAWAEESAPKGLQRPEHRPGEGRLIAGARAHPEEEPPRVLLPEAIPVAPRVPVLPLPL